jgi:hypothetical protein
MEKSHTKTNTENPLIFVGHKSGPFDREETMRRTKCLLLTIAGVIAGLVTLTQIAIAQAVVPPQSESFPQTYGEWSAQWWQYVLGIPADENPLFDNTGAQCGLGQWGAVFFLVGTATTGPVVRKKCKVPADTGLFFPIINISCAVPEDGRTAKDIEKVCSDIVDLVDQKSLFLTIDGTSVPNVKNFRARELFSFTGSAHGPYETTGCATELQPCYADFRATAFSDGYWAMLNPVSLGKHTIHFGGSIPPSFTVDVTYELTVVPQ